MNGRGERGMLGRRAWLGGLLATSLLPTTARARPFRTDRLVEVVRGGGSAHPHPCYAGGLERRGSSPFLAPQAIPAPAARLDGLALPLHEALVDAGGAVHIVAGPQLLTLDAEGEPRARAALGGPVSGASLDAAGEVTCFARGAVMLRVARGAVQERVRLPTRPLSIPAILEDGRVAFFGADRALYVLSRDAEIDTRIPLDDLASGTLSVTPEGDLIALGTRVVRVVRPGAERAQSIPLAAPVYGPVVVGLRGTLWLMARDGLVKIPRGGDPTFVAVHALSVPAGMALDRQGRPWVASRTGVCVALDIDGVERGRSARLGSPSRGGVTVDRSGALLVATRGGALHCVDPSGDVRWRVTTGSPMGTARPVLTRDGAVLLTGARGSLRLYRGAVA